MDNGLTKMAIILAVAGIVISAAAVVVALDDDDDYGTKYTMYVGLNEDSDQVEIHAYIIDTITNDYRNGFTHFEATGGYVAGDIVEKNQITLVYVLNLIDGGLVSDLAKSVKEKFGVAVMVEEQSAKATLIG